MNAFHADAIKALDSATDSARALYKKGREVVSKLFEFDASGRPVRCLDRGTVETFVEASTEAIAFVLAAEGRVPPALASKAKASLKAAGTTREALTDLAGRLSGFLAKEAELKEAVPS